MARGTVLPFVAALTKFNADQPRVPAGSPEGGQWASAGTHPNPISSDGERLVGARGDKGQEMWGGYKIREMPDGTIWLKEMRAITRGGGRVALQHLTEQADRDGKMLTLEAVPLDATPGGGIKMSAKRLREWYKQFGFVREGRGGDSMIRAPKRTLRLGTEVREIPMTKQDVLCKYREDQPRVPAGQSGGGQWTAAGLPAPADWQAHRAAGYTGAAPDTPEFRAWFKESVVRWPDGTPRPAYHGTLAPDFETFRGLEDDLGIAIDRSLGPHFALDQRITDAFSTVQADVATHDKLMYRDPDDPDQLYDRPFEPGGRVVPVYLSVQKPYVLPQEAKTDTGQTYVGHDEWALRDDAMRVALEVEEHPEIFAQWHNAVKAGTRPGAYSELVRGATVFRDLTPAMGLPSEELYARLRRGEEIGEAEYAGARGEQGTMFRFKSIKESDPESYQRYYSGVVPLMQNIGFSYGLAAGMGKDVTRIYRGWLERQGYDAVVYQNTSPMETRHGRRAGQGPALDVWTVIPLRPEQIKSVFNPKPTSNDPRIAKALSFREALAKYDPDQPRDDIGRWTDMGGAGGVAQHFTEVMGGREAANWLASHPNEIAPPATLDRLHRLQWRQLVTTHGTTEDLRHAAWMGRDGTLIERPGPIYGSNEQIRTVGSYLHHEDLATIAGLTSTDDIQYAGAVRTLWWRKDGKEEFNMNWTRPPTPVQRARMIRAANESQDMGADRLILAGPRLTGKLTHIVLDTKEARWGAKVRGFLDRLYPDLVIKRLEQVIRKYNPDQPREPAGSPEGGRWTDAGGWAGGAAGAARHYTTPTQTVSGMQIRLALAGDPETQALAPLLQHEAESLAAAAFASAVAKGELTADEASRIKVTTTGNLGYLTTTALLEPPKGKAVEPGERFEDFGVDVTQELEVRQQVVEGLLQEARNQIADNEADELQVQAVAQTADRYDAEEMARDEVESAVDDLQDILDGLDEAPLVALAHESGIYDRDIADIASAREWANALENGTIRNSAMERFAETLTETFGETTEGLEDAVQVLLSADSNLSLAISDPDTYLEQNVSDWEDQVETTLERLRGLGHGEALHEAELWEDHITSSDLRRAEARLVHLLALRGLRPVDPEALDTLPMTEAERESDLRLAFGDTLSEPEVWTQIRAQSVGNSAPAVKQLMTWRRGISPLEPDRLHASFMEVAPDYQGTGLAKALTGTVLQEITALSQRGIKTVDTHANLSMGGYAWARMGFLPKNDQQWYSLGRKIMERYDHRVRNLSATEQLPSALTTPQARDTLQWLVSGPRTNLRTIADLRHGDFNIGKTLLAGTSWDAKLDLTDPASVGRAAAWARRALGDAPEWERIGEVISGKESPLPVGKRETSALPTRPTPRWSKGRDEGWWEEVLGDDAPDTVQWATLGARPMDFETALRKQKILSFTDALGKVNAH